MIKQKIVYLLKHNLLIQKLYKVIMSFIFKIIGLFIPVDENLVLFVSFMGTKFNDSPKVIFDYMQKHNEYKQYNCIWAFEKPEDYPFLRTVKIDTIKYFYIALKAKYWITNTNIERGLDFKKNSQKYLNTWHGICIKKVGNDCANRKDYNFRKLDFLCVSSPYDEAVYKSAFNASPDCFLKCGMPRNDYLWHNDNADISQLRHKYNIPADKKIILYAPTWRDSIDGGKSYSIKPPIDWNKWRYLLSDKYIVLFRAHHITTKVMQVKFDNFVRDASAVQDVNELLLISDLLITDYSSIACDFSILLKPIFCFAYDKEYYEKERGTYLSMDDLYPGKVYETEDDLLIAILSMNEEFERQFSLQFRNRFYQYPTHATEICCKSLFCN